MQRCGLEQAADLPDAEEVRWLCGQMVTLSLALVSDAKAYDVVVGRLVQSAADDYRAMMAAGPTRYRVECLPLTWSQRPVAGLHAGYLREARDEEQVEAWHLRVDVWGEQ